MLAAPLSTAADGDHWDANPSPDGVAVAFVFGPFNDLNRTDISLVDISSGATRILYGKPGIRAWMPRWSRDGFWIAFISQEAGWNDLWCIRPSGDGLHQVTKLGADISDIEWSPDGGQIACTVNRNGSFELYCVDAVSGESSILRGGWGCHAPPQWAPDGRFLTFEYESPIQPPDLYRMELASRQVTQLTFSNPPPMVNNALVIPECVSYKSADTTRQADLGWRLG